MWSARDHSLPVNTRTNTFLPSTVLIIHEDILFMGRTSPLAIWIPRAFTILPYKPSGKNGTIVPDVTATIFPNPRPETPVLSHLTALAINSTATRVQWKAPRVPTEFPYQYRLSILSGDNRPAYKLTETEYTFTNLMPSTYYSFAVWVLDKTGGIIGGRTVISAETAAEDTPVPRDLTAVALNSTAIHVQWKAPSVSIEFPYKYALSVLIHGEHREHLLEETEYTLTNLEPSTAYHLAVYLIDEEESTIGESAFTTVETPASEVHIPGDFTATVINSTSVYVVWQRPRPSCEYKDEYLLTIYCVDYTRSYTLHGTYITLGDLDTSSIYNLTLQAVWKNGTIIPDVTATILPNLRPDELLVRYFTAWAMSSTAIRVRWQKPIRSAEFRIQYMLFVSNATHEERFDVEETEKTFTGLNPSTIYSFTVQAIWKNGKTVRWHAFASAKTLPAGDPIVRMFAVYALTPTSIRLTWTRPCSSFELQKHFLLTVSNMTFQRSYELENTEETVNSLAPATIYNFTVQAVWKSGLPVRTAAFASTRTLPAGIETAN